MKNNLIIAALTAATLAAASCRRNVAPEFTFENYEQSFDSKQPFSVRMSYIRIANADRNDILKAIELSNRRNFFGLNGEFPRTMKKSFDMAAAQFRTDNNCDGQRISQGDYELIATSDIDVFDRTLSYEIQGYRYTGGAHGISWTKGLNYSLDTGELLSLDDFLTDGQKAALPAALVRLLCMQHGLDATDTGRLTQMGYYIDDIKPTDNFRASATGITFIYNPYEIGPYSLGRTEIELPYAMMDQLLK